MPVMFPCFAGSAEALVRCYGKVHVHVHVEIMLCQWWEFLRQCVCSLTYFMGTYLSVLKLVVAVLKNKDITNRLYAVTVHFDLGSIFEAFVPPEGDGIASLLSGKASNLCAHSHIYTVTFLMSIFR